MYPVGSEKREFLGTLLQRARELLSKVEGTIDQMNHWELDQHYRTVGS